MNDAPIPAATVLLLRDAPALEVLMVERHADIGFAGGALVFPGGRVDPGDGDPRWREHADGLDNELGPAQVASAREAFEEVGILLARKKGAEDMIGADIAAGLSPMRKAVEKDDALFLDLMRREGLRLALDRLVLFAHWVAPPELHKRFDTLFFAALCPPGQRPIEDGDEATEALWISPQAALGDRDARRRKIIFPTARNLELLGRASSAEGALDLARRRPIRSIQPRVVTREGVKYLTIPGDLGYPVTEELLERAMRG